MGDNAVAVGKFATDCAVDKTADCTANILVSVDGTCILHFAVVGDSAEDNTDDTTNKFLVCRVSLIIFFISTIESIFLYEIAIFIFQVIFFQAHLAVVDEGCIFADVDFTSCSIVAEDTANAVNCFIAFSGNTCCADCAFVDDVAIFTKDFTCVVAEESADVSQTINAWTEFNVGKVAVFAVDCALVFVCAHMEFTTKVVCADEATDILFCNDATCTVIREFKFILIGETVAIGIVFCRIPFNFACVDKWRACDIGVTVVEADEATNVGWNVCCQRRCNCKRAVQANALWNACETADVFWVCATCCVDCAVHFNEALFHTSTCAHIADHTTYVLDAIVSTQVDCAVEFHITTEGDEAVRAVIDVTCNTTDWGEISALRIVGCRCLFNENVTIDVAVLKWCGHFCTCCCVCYNSAEIIISADFDVCCGIRGFLWGVTHLTIANAECTAWSLNADDTAYAVVVSSAEGCLLYVATSYVNKWWNVCALNIRNYATNCALVAVDSCVGNHWVCNGETIAWCTAIRHTNDATNVGFCACVWGDGEWSVASACLDTYYAWASKSFAYNTCRNCARAISIDGAGDCDVCNGCIFNESEKADWQIACTINDLCVWNYARTWAVVSVNSALECCAISSVVVYVGQVATCNPRTYIPIIVCVLPICSGISILNCRNTLCCCDIITYSLNWAISTLLEKVIALSFCIWVGSYIIELVIIAITAFTYYSIGHVDFFANVAWKVVFTICKFNIFAIKIVVGLWQCIDAHEINAVLDDVRIVFATCFFKVIDAHLVLDIVLWGHCGAVLGIKSEDCKLRQTTIDKHISASLLIVKTLAKLCCIDSATLIAIRDCGSFSVFTKCNINRIIFGTYETCLSIISASQLINRWKIIATCCTSCCTRNRPIKRMCIIVVCCISCRTVFISDLMKSSDLIFKREAINHAYSSIFIL